MSGVQLLLHVALQDRDCHYCRQVVVPKEHILRLSNSTPLEMQWHANQAPPQLYHPMYNDVKFHLIRWGADPSQCLKRLQCSIFLDGTEGYVIALAQQFATILSPSAEQNHECIARSYCSCWQIFSILCQLSLFSKTAGDLATLDTRTWCSLLHIGCSPMCSSLGIQGALVTSMLEDAEEKNPGRTKITFRFVPRILRSSVVH